MVLMVTSRCSRIVRHSAFECPQGLLREFRVVAVARTLRVVAVTVQFCD